MSKILEIFKKIQNIYNFIATFIEIIMILMKVQSMTEKYQKPPKTEVTMTKKAKVPIFFSTYSSTWPCRFAAGKKKYFITYCEVENVFLLAVLLLAFLPLFSQATKIWYEFANCKFF